MSKNKQSFLKFLIVLLSLIGFAISYVLVLRSEGFVLADAVCGMHSAFDCKRVTSSSWAKIFGISIAFYGCAYYLFLSLWSLLSFWDLKVGEVWSKVVSCLSVLGLVFSVYLFCVSHFIIKALCPFCIALYVVNFLICLVLLVSLSLKSYLSSFNYGLKYLLGSPLSLFKSDKGNSSFMLYSTLFLSVFISFIAPDFYQGMRSIDKESRLTWNLSGSLLDGFVETGLLKDYVKGDKAAPIELVEFSDMECPFCRQAYFTLNDLVKEYRGQVKVVFKNYPLDKSCNSEIQSVIHENACFLAEFARCAGEQGLFWESLDTLMTSESVFEKQGRGALSESLLELFNETEVDKDVMRECVNSRRQIDKVKQDIRLANSLGVESTPSIWINAKKVDKATPQRIRDILDYIVSEKVNG